MKILVTGGAGYIGSILVPELLSCGHEVTVLDSFLYRQASLNHLCVHQNLNVVKGDIRVEGTIRPLLATHDVIIPLAALVGAPLCEQDPVGAQTVNYDAVIMMLKLLARDQWIIMPTTNSAYGSGGNGNHCDENSPLNPLSKYAVDKVQVEKYIMEREFSISFRLATVFGMSPRMRTDLLVNDFVYRAVNDKYVILFESGYRRNYIHVRDVSSAFLHGIRNFSSMKGEIYNIGLSDANLSKLELCQKISNYCPGFIFPEEKIKRDPDQRNYIVSNKKIEATGYTTLYSVDDGILELIKGYEYLKSRKWVNI